MNEGLSNIYIDNLARLYGLNKFRGVFSADNIPLGGSGAFIVNTHPATKPGEHFIVILRRKTKFYYFDSLNLALENYPDVLKRLKQGKHNKKYNPFLNSPIQSPLSSFCGLFCIVFLLTIDERYRPILSKIVPFEKYNLERNDEICIKNLEIFTKFMRNKLI